MSTYSVNNGTVSFNLPDEGTVFRGVGDANTVYKVVNGQLTRVGSDQNIATTGIRDTVTGQVYKAGDVYNGDLHNVSYTDPNFRGTGINKTTAAQQYQGFDQLPEFNIADIQTVLDKNGGKLPTGSTGDATDPAIQGYVNPNASLQVPSTTPPVPSATNPPAGYTNPNQNFQETGSTAGFTNNVPQPGATPSTGAASGYQGPSIVDYLASTGQPSDYASRAALAAANGIQNYTGTAAQNTQLLQTLRSQGTGAIGTNASGITSGGTLGGGTAGTSSSTGSTSGTSAPDTYAGLDPIAKQVKMYTDASTALGLPTIKQQYQKTLDDQKALTDKMNDEIANVNNDPWYSEGVRVKEIQKVQDKYKIQLDTLSNLATVYDSLYKQGQAQVENIVSGAEADVKAANDLAQKKLDAASALAKDNQVVSIGGNEVLVNKTTGKQVAVLGPTPKAASASTGTAAERAAAELQQYGKAFVPGATTADGTPVIDNNGYINPTAWKQAIADYSGSRANFIKEFGYLLFSDANGVSSKYGLTPTEQKLVTGAL